MYHPAAGRHVIEPADMVPLWDNYTVQVKICWYDTDTGAVTRFQDDAADGLAVASLDETEPDLPVDAPQFSITQKFIYMQTLTGYEGDPGSVLEVPKYVQAVDMGTENTLHEVDCTGGQHGRDIGAERFARRGVRTGFDGKGNGR